MKKDKVKIGSGYYQSGYGRGFKKNVAVWLIDGKAYVKDSKAVPFETDKDGYVMVNAFKSASGDEVFGAVGLIREHIKYHKEL